MQDMGIVHGSSTQAVPLIVNKDTVYVHTDITLIEEGLYEYRELQYDKDEYISKIGGLEEETVTIKTELTGIPQINTSEATLDEVKVYQKAVVNYQCFNATTNGFYSTAFDGVTSKFYNCSVRHQGEVTGQLVGSNLGIPITWKAKDEQYCYTWTIEQFSMLAITMQTHIKAHQDKCHEIEAYIDTLTTKEEVLTINFDINWVA